MAATTAGVLVLAIATSGSATTATQVTTLSATDSGTGILVSGVAAFGGQDTVAVGTDPSGDNQGGAATAPLGVDLTGLGISQPDPASPDLLFTIEVSDLPTTGTPETVVYELTFTVGDGPAVYQIRTMRTQVLSSGDALPSAVLSTCPQGELASCTKQSLPYPGYKAPDKEISLTVPTALIGAEPGTEIRPAELGPYQPLQVSATAAGQFQHDEMTGVWDQATFGAFTVPQTTVLLGKAAPGTPQSAVEFTTPAALAADGSFTGTLGGTTPGDYDVWARACFGVNCDTASTSVTVG